MLVFMKLTNSWPGEIPYKGSVYQFWRPEARFTLAFPQLLFYLSKNLFYIISFLLNKLLASRPPASKYCNNISTLLFSLELFKTNTGLISIEAFRAGILVPHLVFI